MAEGSILFPHSYRRGSRPCLCRGLPSGLPGSSGLGPAASLHAAALPAGTRAKADIEELLEPRIVKHQRCPYQRCREHGACEHEPKGLAGTSSACPPSGVAPRLPVHYCIPIILSPADSLLPVKHYC